MFQSFLQWFKGQSPKRRPLAAKSRTYRVRPHLESLEDRTVPAVFNVNSTLDILRRRKAS